MCETRVCETPQVTRLIQGTRDCDTNRTVLAWMALFGWSENYLRIIGVRMHWDGYVLSCAWDFFGCAQTIDIDIFILKIIEWNEHRGYKFWKLNHHRFLIRYGNTTVSNLVQVMACCLMAPSHYLNQCWLYNWWGPVTFIWRLFHKRCLRHQLLNLAWKLLI